MSVLSREPVTLRRVALDCSLSAQDVLRAVSDQPWPFALTGDWAGGGAVVGCSPLAIADRGADPFGVLDWVPPLRADGDYPETAIGGGWFGWLGYRLGRRIENLPEGPPRPVPIPEFHLAYYDHVLRLDPHGRWWFEALVSRDRPGALARRLDAMRRRLAAFVPSPVPYVAPGALRLAPNGRVDHLAAVADCVERIAAGEIFQANICLRLETLWSGSATQLFAKALERIRPAHGAAFSTPWGGVVSLSPELFLRRQGDRVMTAPIKGTTARPRDQATANAALEALRSSPKDAAEHVMIVDLMRNDLGRVCAYGSIEAPRTPQAEPHPGLWHLVSRVHGRMRPGAGDGDLLRATFPPGSVTGAPKVQAMHVIAALERSAREVYTGAIGFVSPSAGLELNVAIRTFELCHGHLWLGVGGGIVADSDPELEFDEALVKARPLAAAIDSSVVIEASAIPGGGAEGRPDPLHGGMVAAAR